ncbi:hypothetical protein M885DRAFT_540958 [Pelagophyceae sp. CCMP2097]|nr:hypothetical protein M885DRAFT_540958 [Pelagophyceae sp. CCMP2097]
MPGDMFSLLNVDGGLAVLKSLCGEVEGGGKWKFKLLSEVADDPKLCLYGWCCTPCLAGQVSEAQGRNCCASGCCLCLCPVFHPFCFAIPDRHDVGKSSYIEDFCLVSSCFCCSTIQLAKEIGVNAPTGWKQLKETTEASAKQAKAEAVAPAPEMR